MDSGTCFNFRVEKAGLNVCLETFQILPIDPKSPQGYPFAAAIRLVKVCNDTQQKQNSSFNKDLCYVSCTCVIHTSLPCTAQSQHFLVMWLTAQLKTAVMIICSRIIFIRVQFTWPCNLYDKVFVKGTMSFLLCTWREFMHFCYISAV